MKSEVCSTFLIMLSIQAKAVSIWNSVVVGVTKKGAKFLEAWYLF
jgi:hypothetical protein